MKINYNDIVIIGNGVVGSAMSKIFPKAKWYDPNKKGSCEFDEANNCDVAFICVPTPELEDGSCDTSIVEEMITKLTNVKLFIIRSTVNVGFTDYIANKTNKLVVFQPEYLGETVAHPFIDLSIRGWLSFGGTSEATEHATYVYQDICNSNTRILQYPAKEVEMAKYMENSFFAAKVTFCNEFYDLCKKMNINYNSARDVWTADPRIGTSHTFVYPNKRGYDGKCLPKDIAAITALGNKEGCDMSFLEAIIEKNKKLQKK